MKKQYDKDGKEIVDWFKSNGASIPITEGQSKEKALSEFTEEHNGLYTTDESGAKYYRQNASYAEILGITQKKRKYPVPKEKLTQSEWAAYYNRLGEIRRGGYVDELDNGDFLICINGKVLFSTKSYLKPIVYLVADVTSVEDINDFMEIFK